ncbi:MAG: hsdS [Bacillus sp. (in: firmicutes)]|nr:hsdS [Bacillus sp. (in: firmicutes)]
MHGYLLQKQLDYINCMPLVHSLRRTLSTIQTYFPLTEEQKKIGHFFCVLNSLITANQRKLEELKGIKKGYLQQIFERKIMFKGHSEPWEQRKLSERFTERLERSSEGQMISVTISSGVVQASSLERKDNSSFDKSGYKVVHVGDIAYNSMRMWQGASGVSPYNGILSPAYTVITPKSGVNSKFFSYQFKLVKMLQIFQRNSQGLTSDTWNLKFSQLKEIASFAPNIDGQREIVLFFKKIDDLIAANQIRLDHLKKLKKAYLQQMFV